jgi:hypothetical protein
MIFCCLIYAKQEIAKIALNIITIYFEQTTIPYSINENQQDYL